MELSFEDLKNTNPKLLENSYEIKEKIGEGAFGTVFKAVDINNGKIVALKEIHPERVRFRRSSMIDEINLIKSLVHPNIVKYYNYIESKNTAFIAMEYLDGGTLRKYINTNKENIGDYEASIIVKQILNALCYLHYTCDICHRDVKPDNIMFEKKKDINSLRLLDFGLSRGCFEFSGPPEKCGTPAYMAPEQLSGKSYSKAVDMWSVGVISFILVNNGRHPFITKGDTLKTATKKIKSKKPVFTGKVSLMAKHFIGKLLSKNPSHRYTARQALKHPWITRDKYSEIPMTIYDKYIKYEYREKLKELFLFSTFINCCKKFNELKEKETLEINIKNNKIDATQSTCEYSASNDNKLKDIFDLCKYKKMVDDTSKKYRQIFKEKRSMMFDPKANSDEQVEKITSLKEKLYMDQKSSSKLKVPFIEYTIENEEKENISEYSNKRNKNSAIKNVGGSDKGNGGGWINPHTSTNLLSSTSQAYSKNAALTTEGDTLMVTKRSYSHKKVNTRYAIYSKDKDKSSENNLKNFYKKERIDKNIEKNFEKMNEKLYDNNDKNKIKKMENQENYCSPKKKIGFRCSYFSERKNKVLFGYRNEDMRGKGSCKNNIHLRLKPTNSITNNQPSPLQEQKKGNILKENNMIIKNLSSKIKEKRNFLKSNDAPYKINKLQKSQIKRNSTKEIIHREISNKNNNEFKKNNI